MTEAILKGNLVKELRLSFPSFVIIRHEDSFTHGIPDISIDGNKITSWIEVKYANPTFASKGIQELTMLRLANASHAFYVVYFEKAGNKRTYFIAPHDIGNSIESWCNYVDGFNHKWIIENIKGVHYVNYNRT